MLKERIFWHDTVRMPSDEDLTPLPEKADVAIIGGGFTGLSAARTLAQRGARAVVLEAETIGWGASSRNGGMTLTGINPSMQFVTRKYGRELARRIFQCSLDAVATVEQIVKEENIDCGFARYGHLLTANKASHYRALADEVDFLEREFNHHTRLLSAIDLGDEIGTRIYHGALLDELSGGLNPAQYVAGLAGAAVKAGAGLCPRAGVIRLERSQNRFVLETVRGRVEAQNVLVATSGYTGRATPWLQRRIIPIGSYIIATEKLPDELAHEISPKNRMIFDTKHFLNYFRLWENRLVFGGRAAFFPATESTTRESAEILRREMVGVYPQLKDVKVEYVWGGSIDFTFDLMPHLGQSEGVYHALGYSGHGVAMATYFGQSAANTILNGNVQDHPFASFPFERAPLGLYDGTPWFLPFVGLWHKVLDWVS